MNHPLVWNSRRIRPKQPKFHVFSRIKWLYRIVQQKAFPIHLFFAQPRDEFRAAPATRLIDIPSHQHAYDVTELAAPDVIVRGLIHRRTPPLRTYLHDAPGIVYGLA